MFFISSLKCSLKRKWCNYGHFVNSFMARDCICKILKVIVHEHLNGASLTWAFLLGSSRTRQPTWLPLMWMIPAET